MLAAILAHQWLLVLVLAVLWTVLLLCLKKALLRPTNVRNAHPEYAKLEEELLELINQTGIGPQLGGTTSALAVNIEWGPTHIAGLPVAVTICCHACRHSKRVL